MSKIVAIGRKIPPMSDTCIDKVRQLEEMNSVAPQIFIPTSHLLHGGLYSRTIKIPAGVLLTGALIKIATTIIVSGNIVAYIGDGVLELDGYNIIPASANRKQAFVANTDTYMTMIFPTLAETVEEAEKEFTDEVDMLSSRKHDEGNHVIITGE